jgi:predicted metal-dependent phosphoesterase TrpH
MNRVVVTDHNRIEEAFKAKDLDPDFIIIGEEIETTEGEILAAYMTEEIPPGLPPLEVIKRLRAQNAFISISHPFDPNRKGGWNIKALRSILPHIDAIETFNARCLRPVYNNRAQAFASEHGLMGTHGSDAHAPFEIGRGSLILPNFHDSQSLRVSLKEAVSPRLKLSAPWVHLTSRYAAWRKRWEK